MNDENKFGYELNFSGNGEIVLTRIAESLEKIESLMAKVVSNTSKVSGELDKVNDAPLDDAAKAANKLKEEEESAAKSAKDLADRQERLADSIDKVKSAAKPVGEAILGIGAAGVAAGIGLWKLVDAQTELGDSQSKAARNLGMSLEKYSEISYVTDMAGVSQEKLRVSLQTLARNATMDKDAFKDLGISVTDSSGKLKSTDKLFFEVGDKLRNLPDKTKAAGLAMRVMGEQGAAMISAFGGSQEDWDAVAERGKKLGTVLSNDFGEMSENYQDAWADMTKSIGGAARNITSAVAPELTTLFNHIADRIAALSSDGSFAGLDDKLNGLVGTLSDLADTVIDLAPRMIELATDAASIADKVLKIADAFGESDVALKALEVTFAGVFGGMAIAKVLKLLSALKEMRTAYLSIETAAKAASVAQGVAGAAGKASIGNVTGSIAGKAGIYGALITAGTVAWGSAISDFYRFMKEKGAADSEAQHNIQKMTDEGNISDLKVAIRKETDPSKKLNMQLDLQRAETDFETKYYKEIHPAQTKTAEDSKQENKKEQPPVTNVNVNQTNNISTDLGTIGKLIDENLEDIVKTQLRYQVMESKVSRLGGA